VAEGVPGDMVPLEELGMGEVVAEAPPLAAMSGVEAEVELESEVDGVELVEGVEVELLGVLLLESVEVVLLQALKPMIVVAKTAVTRVFIVGLQWQKAGRTGGKAEIWVDVLVHGANSNAHARRAILAKPAAGGCPWRPRSFQ
jgi:hypothetical protein